jgi:hypothetical protein
LALRCVFVPGGGLVFGLGGGLLGLLVGLLVVGLGGVLVGGLVYGLIGVLYFGLGGGLFFGMFNSLGFVLASVLSVGLGGVLVPAEVEERSTPNQGIETSARNALRVGLVFELVVGLGNGLVVGLVVGLGGGLIGGLSYGRAVVIQHYAVRLVLWRSDYMPLRYVRFLDEAAGRLLLRRVGGGYEFVHPLLQDFFAALTDADAAKIVQGTARQA